MIRILLADDHPLVREGTRTILDLEPDLEVSTEVGDYDDLLKSVDSATDVIVTDISMPGLGIDRAMRELNADHPGVPVLLISMCEQDALEARARRLGAAGGLDMNRASKELANAIRAVAAGRAYPLEQDLRRS